LLEYIYYSSNPETIEGFNVWVLHVKLESKIN
jgi:hypothetical protein